MPTAAEIAQQQADRRLARAGLNPDGSPLGSKPPARAAVIPPDDETDEERLAREEEEEEERLRLEAEGGGDGGGDGGDDGEGEDDRAQEIADLRQQLAALQGRLAPTQRDAEDFRRLLQGEQLRNQQLQAQRDREVQELRDQLEQRNSQINLEDVLTDEEREGLDPAMLQTVLKLADAVAQKRAPKSNARAEALAVLEEREQAKVTEYRNKVLTDPARGLHQISELAYNAKFTAWCKEDDNEVDSVLQSLLDAKSTEEIDRYARIVSRKIAKFKEGTKASRPAANADARTRLAAGMRRNPAPKMTAAEADAKFAEAKRLSRSSNPADRAKAQTILADLS